MLADPTQPGGDPRVAAVTLTGDIQARVQTDLSFRVGGKIIQRSVDVGDHVSANQVLARERRLFEAALGPAYGEFAAHVEGFRLKELFARLARQTISADQSPLQQLGNGDDQALRIHTAEEGRRPSYVNSVVLQEKRNPIETQQNLD